MKIHRFITRVEQEGNKYFITKPDIVFQMFTVLKLKPGESVVITDGKGKEESFEILAIKKTQVEVQKKESIKKSTQESTPLHAYVSILKKDNFELTVQKMTELGITDITPVLSDRTVKTGYNKERLEKIITEAVEQSGQSILPTLHTELSLTDAIEDATIRHQVIICFDEPEEEKTLDLKNTSTAFFVGPEGGWTPKEIELFKEHKAQCVSLGDTTLRGETAAIVGTFYLQRLQK